MNRTQIKALAIVAAIIAAATTIADDKTPGNSNGTPFTADAYLAHVKYLASDELAGRAPGSEGAAKAAQYIVEHFKAAGCKPAGVNETWFQPFDARNGKQLADDKASLKVDGLDQSWKLREDWIPFPFSEFGEVEGPLAFAGFGIQAPNFEYDDFEGFDAQGKILLVFRYEPKSDNENAAFGGATPSRHALFVRKARAAAKNGAKALVIVNPPSHSESDDLYPFDTFNTQQTYQVPMIHVKREVAAALLAKAGMPDLKTLEERLTKEHKSLAKDLGLSAKINVGLKPNNLAARNVLGMIPGAGGTKETIVVGAHRDHLGIVARQFQRDDMTPMIHNGADDNAAGTAAVIELARVLAADPTPRRNILFIAFDGEEMGLLGSRHYVNNPTVALEDIRAMINFDMIGRLSQNKYTVFGQSSGAEFPKIVGKYAEQLGLTYKAPRGMAGGSDHTPFLRRKIPGMFAFTGIHKQYHQPEDDWELIDADGGAKILTMWRSIILDLANMEEGPTFTEPSDEPAEDVESPKPAVDENAPEENGDDGDGQAAAKDSDAPPSRGGMSVSLRIVPDMVGDDQPGMLVESVVAGGPAAEAGIKDGDRLMKIGDDDIRDIFAYMRSLQGRKTGETVKVVVKRGVIELTLDVKLKASSRKKVDE